jgi:hypothetical protein
LATLWRIWNRKHGNLAGDPSGEVFGECECMGSLLCRRFEHVSRITEFRGKWGELDGMGKKPLKDGCGWEAKVD